MLMLHVEHLPDEVVEAHGFAITDNYCETYWLPVIGPSALWMARRLVAIAPARIAVGDLALCMGLGSGVARHSPVMRTLKRLADFNVAEVRPAGSELDDVAVAVRTHLDRIRPRMLSKLPAQLRAAHQLDDLDRALLPRRAHNAVA